MRWIATLAALVSTAWAPVNIARAEKPGESATPDFAATLDRILTSHGQPRVQFAGHVIELPGGRVLYDQDGEKPLIPASNMKLIIMAAAIDQLGRDYQFKTTLAVCDKNLVVIGGGDPTIGDERLCRSRKQPITASLQDWADKLVAAGVRQIPGDILIDDSIFDRQFTHPNWPPEQFQEWYEAPIGGLNFGDNCVNLRAAPTTPGKPADVTFVPGNTGLRLTGSPMTGAKNTLSVQRRAGSDTFVAKGTVAKAQQLGPLTVHDPGLYLGYVLKTVLASKGVKVLGNVRREKVPRDKNGDPVGCHKVAVHKTPLTDALSRAGKQSLGMMAEGLIKLLGARKSGMGSWDSGRAAVDEYLQKVGVSSAEAVIDDGSGLSRRNRLSPAAMTRVLQYTFNAPGRQFSTLKDALSRSGIDGTLEKRLRDPATKGRIYAKTGYINGVRTLAGYVETKSGTWLAFAFFYNNAGSTQPLTRVQDEACRVLAGWPNLSH